MEEIKDWVCLKIACPVTSEIDISVDGSGAHGSPSIFLSIDLVVELQGRWLSETRKECHFVLCIEILRRDWWLRSLRYAAFFFKVNKGQQYVHISRQVDTKILS